MNTSPLDPAFHPGAGVTEPTLAASLRGGGGITPAAHPTPYDEARTRDISGFLAFVAETRCARLTHRRDGELTEHGIDSLITRYLAERPRSPSRRSRGGLRESGGAMTILPVPIAGFRANLKKYTDMLRGGNLEILVTNHGKAILRCLTPDDVIPEVENPPGVNVELMERLLSGEGEPARPAPTIIDFEVKWREPADGTVFHVAADLSSGSALATAKDEERAAFSAYAHQRAAEWESVGAQYVADVVREYGEFVEAGRHRGEA